MWVCQPDHAYIGNAAPQEESAKSNKAKSNLNWAGVPLFSTSALNSYTDPMKRHGFPIYISSLDLSIFLHRSVSLTVNPLVHLCLTPMRSSDINTHRRRWLQEMTLCRTAVFRWVSSLSIRTLLAIIASRTGSSSSIECASSSSPNRGGGDVTFPIFLWFTNCWHSLSRIGLLVRSFCHCTRTDSSKFEERKFDLCLSAPFCWSPHWHRLLVRIASTIVAGFFLWCPRVAFVRLGQQRWRQDFFSHLLLIAL